MMTKFKSSKRNKKSKKKVCNRSAENRLNAIKYVQKRTADYMLSGEMLHVDHTLLFYRDKPIPRNQQVSQALEFVRFEWTIMLGVLCRSPNGKMYVKQTILFVGKHDPLLARELNNIVQTNLRKLWNECNKDHRLTGFFVCRPADKDIPDSIPAQLLHHFRTPSKIFSNYEIYYKVNVPDWFDDNGRTKSWEELLLDIDWIEAKFEPVNVTIYRQSHEEALADYKNYIEEQKLYGKTLPRNFEFKKSSNEFSTSRAFNIRR